MIALVVIGIGRMANYEGQSWVVWGGLTLLMCTLAVMFVPYPALRTGGVALLMFAAYVGYKIVANK